MTQFDDLVKNFSILFDEILEHQKEYKRGLLGDGYGNINVSGREDYVWVRQSKFSSKLWQVFNKRVLNAEEGTPILIGELPWQPGLSQVVSIDWQAYSRQDWDSNYSGLPVHGQSHQYPSEIDRGPDSVLVYMPAIQPLKATADGVSLEITIQAYSYFFNGILKNYLGGTVDLSAYPVSTLNYAKYILLYLAKESNTIAIKEGAETLVSTTTPKPIPPNDSIPICFIRLTFGQTTISNTDIEDARELLSSQLDSNNNNGLVPTLIPIDETFIIPLNYQMVIHNDDLTVSGDLTLNGDLIFDTDKFVEVPESATAPGTRGQYALDSNYLYVCYEENSWKRISITGW